jgi:hypothetical protein
MKNSKPKKFRCAKIKTNFEDLFTFELSVKYTLQFFMRSGTKKFNSFYFSPQNESLLKGSESQPTQKVPHMHNFKKQTFSHKSGGQASPVTNKKDTRLRNVCILAPSMNSGLWMGLPRENMRRWPSITQAIE